MSAVLRGTRRDFADWPRREPVWSVFACLMGALYVIAALAFWLSGLNAILPLALAFMQGAYIGAKLEVSHVWRVVGRVAAGQARSMSYTDPETGATTVFDLSGNVLDVEAWNRANGGTR